MHGQMKLLTVMKKVGSLIRTIGPGENFCRKAKHMTLSTSNNQTGSVSARVLKMPLAALGDASAKSFDPTGGYLPGAIELDAANLLIVATSLDAPRLLDTIEQVTSKHRRDVMIVRMGAFPEVFSPVTVDVALEAGGDVLVMTDLAFFRHVDRTLWLIPEGHGPCIEIQSRGLRLEMISPFLTSEDRTDGLCRAAAEIVRLATPGQGR